MVLKSSMKKWKAEIHQLHKDMIQAHWDKNLDWFTKDIDKNYMRIKDGDIDYPTVEEIRTQFTNYLYNTTFSQYEDIMEPIIEIADDGSIAWSLVKVKIVGKRKMDDGSIVNLDFVCAWITMYTHIDDKWIRKGEISTFR
ncbi:hypothetical protein [Candidatus Lokiarchaeum ossiferum]